MKKRNILIVFILLSSSFAVGNDSISCREIFYKKIKFCSVSFYEILSNSHKYDGVNIRITGYLKHSPEGTLLSVDKTSLEGTMILDNVVGIQVSNELGKIYSEQDGNLVVVYGTYRGNSHRYRLARGELSSVVLVEPHQ